jgi:diguanylate cyclase (GGDEF)-like protein
VCGFLHGFASIALAKRLLDNLISEKHIGSGEVSVSLGVAAFRPGDTQDSIVKRADEALYEAKTNGRCRVEAK